MSKEREMWLRERQGGIGGSDAAAIIGCNPYKSNVELWKEKTGRTTAEDISDKPYVQYGINAERPLRELFALDYPQYKLNYNEYKLIKHPAYPFIFATLDGELIDEEANRRGVLEVKTTNILQSMQREKWDERIPDNYYAQVIHQLLASGFDFAILKAQLKTVWQSGEVRLTTRHYHVERKDVEDDIEYLLKEEIKFWECVEKDKEPNLRLPKI